VNRLTITRPDDWHLHLRDGEVLQTVLPDSARRFARAIVMPNLKPPVVSTADALAYRERILAALPQGMAFEPLMTLYLTEATLPEEIVRACDSGLVQAVKYYPAGATTNAASGVRDPRRCYPVFEEMQRQGMPLLLHGESIDPTVDVFDREAVFIEQTLNPLVRAFPQLRIVLEHITTQTAVDFVTGASSNVAATITVHHLLMNRNAMFQGGIRPHLYCLPVLKRERHRQALVGAATGGNPKFFLGTDSAPHPRHAKESTCGCAGIYTAHAAIELYAEVFEAVGALDRLEAFASFHGADFYRLPRNRERLVLEKADWTVPEEVPFGRAPGVPLRAGETVHWHLVD
jgi:dihydroorotase